MHEQLTQVLGLEGFAVTAVDERGDELDLDLELVAGRLLSTLREGKLKVKERPLVRVRDLPLAGRRAFLRWRKRRFHCAASGRSFTESHEQLPPRQRVTRGFRERLFERTREGAAHLEVRRAEETTRYQVGRAFALGVAGELAVCAGHRPPRRLAFDEAHHLLSWPTGLAMWTGVLVVALAGSLYALGVRDVRCYALTLISFPVVHGLIWGNAALLLMPLVALPWVWREVQVAVRSLGRAGDRVEALPLATHSLAPRNT